MYKTIKELQRRLERLEAQLADDEHLQAGEAG
jgi:hypothetical protein